MSSGAPRPLLAAAAAGLALAVGAGSVFGPAALPVSAADAPRRTPFSARVQVAWVDHAGQHSVVLDVHAVDGTVRVEGPADLPGRPGAGRVLHDSGWTLLAPAGDDGVLAARLARKYDLERGPGPPVAGRDTTLLSLRRDGQLREKLAVDRGTGLVLQREQFDAAGRPVRVVTVLHLDTSPVAAGSVDEVHHRSEAPEAVDVEALPTAFRAPAALAAGFRQVGAYRRARGVHLLYTDGLHGLSLFIEPGELARRNLPANGEAVSIGRARGLRYTWPGGQVVTWQSGPMVHTLVGDAAATELLAAARSLPHPGRAPFPSRLRATCRMVAELVSGGR